MRARTGVTYSNRVGIGRAVDQEWVSSFMETFESLAPPSCRLSPRSTPGITYVSGLDLEKVSQDYRDAARQQKAEEYLEELLGRLRAAGQLDPITSTQRVDGPIESFRFSPQPGGAKRIQAKVWDTAHGFYPSGLLIRGEKLRVLSACGVENEATQRTLPARRPRALLKIGLVDDPRGGVNDRLLEQIGRSMPRTAVLLPVGIIKL